MSVVLPRTCPDVGEMLSSHQAQEKKEDRACIIKILSNLKFLARQGKLHKCIVCWYSFTLLYCFCISFQITELINIYVAFFDQFNPGCTYSC